MNEQKNPKMKWLVLLLIIVILGGLVAFVISKRSGFDQDDLPPAVSNTNVVPSDTVSTKPSETTTTVSGQAAYKDGTYSATGSYRAPSGDESIKVDVTLKNDVVTDVVITPRATNPASKAWQTTFASGVKSVVVGKKIQDLQVDSVSGSSLTPVGFMDALNQIKTQAKA